MDKLYIKCISLVDYIKNKIEEDPEYFAFGEIELKKVDNVQEVLNSLGRFSLNSSLENFYTRANNDIEHLYFSRALCNYGFLFDQSKIYKQIPFKYLKGFIEVLFYLNEFILAYDLATFVYFNICKQHYEYELEAQELLMLIKDMEKLSKDISDSKDTSKLEEYIEERIVKTNNLLNQDKDFILNQMGEITNLVDAFSKEGI